MRRHDITKIYLPLSINKQTDRIMILYEMIGLPPLSINKQTDKIMIFYEMIGLQPLSINKETDRIRILYKMIGLPPQTKQQARVNHRNSNSQHNSQVSNLYFVTKISTFVTKIPSRLGIHSTLG